MISQNTFLGLIAKAPTVHRETKSGEVYEKASNKHFSDTFDKALNNLKGKDNNNRADRLQRDDYRNDPKVDRREQTKTFKDVVRSNSKELKKDNIIDTAADDNAVQCEDDTNKTKVSSKPKAEVEMSILADVMGLNAVELVKLFNALDLKPEDLADSAKTDEILNKLTTFLGLNPEQKKTLESIFKLMANQVDSMLKDINIKEDMLKTEESGSDIKVEEKEGWIRVNNVEVEVVKEPKEEFAGIMAKLKAKLEELSLKLQQNPQAAMNEVADGIRKLLAKMSEGNNGNITGETRQVESLEPQGISSEKVKPDIQNTIKQDSGKEENTKVENSNAQAEENPAGDSGKKNGNDGSFSGETKVTHHQHNQDIRVGDNKTDQFNQALTQQSEKGSNQGDVAKVQKEVHVLKSEIFSQVIEKAKVVTNGEKSEMVMDLKPESLGKLSLKIVTERGIVMAKFVAENQQVKEILESNMQLLKDSLEKQGLSVQGFSVSVEQHFSKGFNGHYDAESNNKSGSNRVSAPASNMVNTAAVHESLQKPNPYNWSNSKINLTA